MYSENKEGLSQRSPRSGRLARILLLVAATFTATGYASAAAVYLQFDPANAQANYAAGQLRAALLQKNHTVISNPAKSDFRVTLALNPKLGAESYDVAPKTEALTIAAGDGRGLIYGAFSVVEQLENGTALKALQKAHDAPTVRFRAIKFDLPWDSYRASAAIDQHYATVKDAKYWEAFFDMLARNRFNAITLSNLAPWPYMVRTEGFPQASSFDDKQFEEWRQLHRAIFRLAKERGIDTYLLPFNIFVSREFAAAYKVGAHNTYPRYNTEADTSPLIRDYIRTSLTQILREYPDLAGLGINLGEGMGGMSGPERISWVNDTYLAAIRAAKRPVKLMWSINSVETKEWNSSSTDHTVDERMLRKAFEDIDYVDGPIMINLKFNWSHAMSTPTLAQIHGGKLGDTYFKPAPRNYKIDWIARNEDIFALRWGVPTFVRQHVLTNGTPSYVGGYTVGSETYIPAFDYFTAVKEGVDWKYAFERQWLFYKLWGRLLYNPDTPDSVFADEFTRRYGAKGKNLLSAYELASATPLRLASLFYSQWDHTLYSEGMLWLKGRTMAYIGADSLIGQPVLDPAYVSIADYVDATLKGEVFGADRVTPPVLANRLQADCTAALRLVDGIDTTGNTALTYEVASVKIWAHLGLHLAEKVRGTTALQTYRKAGGAENKTRAIAHLENALAQWDTVVDISRPLYPDMWLTHFIGQSKTLNPDGKFHWALVRPQVAADVELARNAVSEK